MMKAITQDRYGSPDVLRYGDWAKPVPSAEQVLVSVHAASVNAADWHLMRADPFLARFGSGLFKPKNPIPGLDAAGVVEAVGSAVTRFKPGDEVFGSVNGAFAEYACTNQKNLAIKPANVNFQQAAAVPTAGVTALQGLRDHGGLKAGQRVLINGGASGVGVYAIQIAKAFGAHVTAVCGPGKLDVARACGADHVIDHTLTNVLAPSTQDAPYDVILDNASFRQPKDYARIMTPNGVYVIVGGTLGNLLKLLFGGKPKGAGQRYTGFYASIRPDDIQTLADMLAAGTLRSPIDRCFPLSQTADAIRYMEARKVKGKIVIAVQ
jgi:NADPH:quinone reductase-like Zn-dependent oxidoreductase